MAKNKKKMNSVNVLGLSMAKGAVATEVMLPGLTAASEREFTLPDEGSTLRATASEEEAEGSGWIWAARGAKSILTLSFWQDICNSGDERVWMS